MSKHVVVFSIPGLRRQDVTPQQTPTLSDWAGVGALAELIPTFPCVTSPVQASMVTGTPPSSHGVIANGFFHRDRNEVEFWVGRNDVITGRQVWDELRARHPGYTSAVWHLQNIKDAGADFIVTPAPIHEPDGTTRLWCYSKPEGLYQQLLDALGQFPLQHYWGPLSGIGSTKWILDAAAWLIEKHRPNLNWVYVPHLDYAAQKFGPNSSQAQAAVAELDRALGDFAQRVLGSAIGRDVVFLAVGEYALTDVTGVIYPNRILREAGLLAVRKEGGAEYIDLKGSKAFAMVDHQFAHVYVQAGERIDRVAELFRGTRGVAGVYQGAERAQVGIDHPRSGDVVLVCDDARWCAYYWWLDDAAAPAFGRTVDIHRKPGYDPVELFFDPVTKGIPLDAGLVKGSHGAPAMKPRQRTALVCSAARSTIESGRTCRDTDIKRIALSLFDTTPVELGKFLPSRLVVESD